MFVYEWRGALERAGKKYIYIYMLTRTSDTKRGCVSSWYVEGKGLFKTLKAVWVDQTEDKPIYGSLLQIFDGPSDPLPRECGLGGSVKKDNIEKVLKRIVILFGRHLPVIKLHKSFPVLSFSYNITTCMVFCVGN